jgi:RNA polymerase sigma factor (sigma-70 family)
MVLGVGRRVLGNVHDAEDAFQATFLVLARRAASVAPREMVGNWLYGVAYRTALEARRMAARRRATEARLKDRPRSPTGPAADADLSAVLDQELSRLTDRLRLPVVLCDLEGRTRRDVARQLGIPDGTLSNRLAAARRVLAKRLAARGVTLPAAGLAVFLTQTGATAVPSTLLDSTVRTALGPAGSGTVHALTCEVVKAMYLTKLKTLTAALVVAGALAGAGAWGGRAATAEPPPKSPTPAAPKGDPPAGSAEMKAVLDKAEEALKSLPAADDAALRRKADRLVTVAHQRARYGDRAGAAGTFRVALETAEKIKADEPRAEALANAGFYQANAGLADDARKTAEKIALKSEAQTREYRGRVLAEVASALATAGDFAEALKVAEAIPDRVVRIKAKGKEEERRDARQRDRALQHVAGAQQKAGDLAGAVKTARRVKDEGQRFQLLEELVLAHAQAKDGSGAKKLFEDLRREMDAAKDYPKAGRDHAIALLQAAMGDAAGAVGWAEKLESADDRADALFAVSIGLAYREMWKKK